MVLDERLSMRVEPIDPVLATYLRKCNLQKKFEKQLAFFLDNPRHPSLHTERLEPPELKLYSFRIDREYRVVFLFLSRDSIEIVDVNDHYQ